MGATWATAVARVLPPPVRLGGGGVRRQSERDRRGSTLAPAVGELGIFGHGPVQPLVPAAAKATVALEHGQKVGDLLGAAGPLQGYGAGELGLGDEALGLGACEPPFAGSDSFGASPSRDCGTPARGKSRRLVVEAMSVEDLDTDWRDATYPQVVINRPSPAAQTRGRQSQQSPEQGQQTPVPFDTSLDVGFLSLFAS